MATASSSLPVAVDEQDRQFLARIKAAIQTAKAWDEDPTLLEECRAQIPLSKLCSTTTGEEEEDDVLYTGNALFLKRLTRYFKNHVMKWVNNPPCIKCGSDKTEARNTRGPETDEERNGGASRVETYYCPTCQDPTTTFPRYNSCRKLLETRKGRCGEFANLFGLYCRSVGFETRYISDFTDHVWVECYVDGHWIMADSCEGLIDKYGMYESGWGKKLNYILGATVDSVVDITPRYTRKWFDPDFQARRRSICSSEEASQQIIRQVNHKMLRQGLPAKRIEELDRRMEREQKHLGAYQQATAWTEEEKHGQGRISGSLQWKVQRQEAGEHLQKKEEDNNHQNQNATTVQSWHVESFYPNLPRKSNPKPVTIHIRPDHGICISGASCSVVNTPISVVVLDQDYLGCVLQSRGFKAWSDVSQFVQTLPTHRIVALLSQPLKNGKELQVTNTGMSRLGGFTLPTKTDEGVLYLGQVEAKPEWSHCILYCDKESCDGIQIELPLTDQHAELLLKLRTERDTVPRRVALRLPESLMPLQTQLLATEEQKRAAFLRFAAQQEGEKRYVGYCTKPESPVYLLDSSAYPFAQAEADCGWNTFHYLPEPLVPEDDVGIIEKSGNVPKVDIPLDPSFTSLLGPSLLVKNGASGSTPTLMDTASALHNSRLVALYFSAHWCGPCRSFTPMLAELYSHLKEEFPTHGLEIVFVSSDRDDASFQQYHATMPWMAIPMQSGGMFIQNIKARFGVRGIPALVVLDAMSGQVVVPMSETRSEVMQACQGGDTRIESMLQSWISRIPQESQEILAMMELSYEETTEEAKGGGDSNSKIDHPYLVRPASESSVDEAVTDPGPLNDLEWKSIEKPLAESTNDIASEVAKINASGNAAVQAAVGTALKYLENAKREPWTPKFRSFKLSNKIVDRITKVEKALDLLYSLGLYMYASESDFMACIPLGADLDEMEKSMKVVLAAFPQ